MLLLIAGLRKKCSSSAKTIDSRQILLQFLLIFTSINMVVCHHPSLLTYRSGGQPLRLGTRHEPCWSSGQQSSATQKRWKACEQHFVIAPKLYREARNYRFALNLSCLWLRYSAFYLMDWLDRQTPANRLLYTRSSSLFGNAGFQT